MTLDQAIAIWGTYEGLAAVSAGVLIGFTTARLLRRKSAEIHPEAIGELTRVDAKNGVVSMTINTQGLKAGNKVRLVLVGIAMLLVGGCSALTGQQTQDVVNTAQDAVDTAVALCNNALLRSETNKTLLDSGMLPETASDGLTISSPAGNGSTRAT